MKRSTAHVRASLNRGIDRPVLRDQLGAGLDETEEKHFSLLAYLVDKPLFADLTDYPDAGGLMIIDRQAAGQGDEICTMAEGDRMLHRIMVREFCMAYWSKKVPVSLPESLKIPYLRTDLHRGRPWCRFFN